MNKHPIFPLSRPTLLTFLFLVTSHLSFLTSFAQADPPLRIELESAKDQQDYKFFSLGNQGVAVFYQSAILSLDTAQWVFIHYDTNLVRTDLYKLKIPNLCQYLAADFSNNKLYLFLQKPAFKKDTIRNYLLEWNITTNGFQLFDLQNYKHPYLSSIKVADDYLFMTVNDPKARSIIYYNYKNHTKQAIQFSDDEIISIESFCVDTVLKKTSFCMFLENKQGSRAEFFTTDYSGRITAQAPLPFHPNVIYNSTRISLVGKDSLLLSGGYSNSKDKKSKGSYTGIYTLLLVKNKFSDINTYPFGALLNNESTLNRHFSEPNVTMNAYIRQSNGHVFAITELFYPEYQYNSSSSYGGYRYYGYEPPTQTFAGFRFVHAYILEFDAQGLLLNDWIFPINNVLTQSLYNLVNLNQDKENNTLMYYVYGNEITSQFVNGKHVLTAQAAIPVELLSKADYIEYSSNQSMRHWYDNTFLLAGYQYIKNSQRGKKRYVFFLNKLMCE
ncbi:MAG: hypothetical protein FWC10_00850 [Lentimicrobiaceae bacterium]|nr:hypothetical protein [Lentimicrobiaceae bacterium]